MQNLKQVVVLFDEWWWTGHLKPHRLTSHGVMTRHK